MQSTFIGQPLDRVDGPAKVTGRAKYAAEFPFPNLAHSYAFNSTIAKGRVTNIDTARAEKIPGVIAVITHANAPKLKPITREMKLTGQPGHSRAPLHDDQVHYAGQYLGIVVAETLEAARYAAGLVKITYAEEPHTIDPRKPIEHAEAKDANTNEPVSKKHGDADSAFASSAITIDHEYTTPIEHHNPMETMSTTAVWDGDHLLLHDATQHVAGVRAMIAAMFEIGEDNVRVISPYIGGGFGCKGSLWSHVGLTALAAKHVNRPVKLMISRQQQFFEAGHRPSTLQKISFGADKDGKLTSIIQDVTSSTSDFDNWTEVSSRQTGYLYNCDNIKITQRLARINTVTPCQMRAPGIASGMAVLEIAMDELAYATGVDPVELRVRNFTDKDHIKNVPASSKSLKECYQQGADKFGWSKRTPEPRSMRDGKILIGYGMATATYPTERRAADCNVRLTEDGRAIVSISAHDIGTGAYTILTQIAAETLALPADKVTVRLADTALPTGPVAGGSQTTASAGSAVLGACKAAIARLANIAVADSTSSLHGKDPEKILARDGKICFADDPSICESITGILRKTGRPIDGSTKSKPDPEAKKYSMNAWGAHFAEVRVDENLGEIRVSRFIGVFAAGKIVNPKTARSQLIGGIVWGISMALHEKTHFDPRTGKIVNDNLADYLVPVNADCPHIESYFVEEQDDKVNPLGVKGIGELGVSGSPAAVANAVYHATGKRVRDLPITLDVLL